jgi:hypothetical protein
MELGRFVFGRSFSSHFVGLAASVTAVLKFLTWLFKRVNMQPGVGFVQDSICLVPYGTNPYLGSVLKFSTPRKNIADIF